MFGERPPHHRGLAGRTMDPEATYDDDVGQGHDGDWKEEQNDGDEGVVELARRRVVEGMVDYFVVRCSIGTRYISDVRLH